MHIPFRPLALGLLVIGFSAVVLNRAQAGGSHFYPPVSNAVVKGECGSCHLAFPASMLPASSWSRMMSDLKNHFGDDASIDPALARQVTQYLVANAADAGGRRYSERLMRGVTAGQAPLRITELPKWTSEHRKVPAWEWKHKDVRTKANCVACHADAEQGYFND